MPMMNDYFNHSYSAFPAFGFGLGGLVLLLVIWELVWKGLALWRAARNGHNGWFVALLIINTLGRLPILYLYVFSPRSVEKLSETPEEAEKPVKD